MLQEWQKRVIEKAKKENLQTEYSKNEVSDSKEQSKEKIKPATEINYKKSGIISLDPSGTSISAIFYYQSPTQWEFFNFKDKDWIKQVGWVEGKLKELNPKIILVETGLLFRKYRYDYNMVDLIRMVGGVEYLTKQTRTEYERVSNEYRKKWGEEPARQGLVGGLEPRKIKGEKGWPRRVWFFKEKEINEHERDALLIFYAWWVKRRGQKWPFQLNS